LRWIELSVTTAPQSSEAVAAKLMELDAGGVSFEEAWDWEQAARDGLGDIFPASSELDKNIVIIRGYLPLSFLGREKAAQLEAFLAALPGFGLNPAVLSCREVDDSLWEGAWKKYWQPTEIGEKLLIVPSWCEAPPTARLVLRLDPGPAFGTGTHESTRLCLELLEEQIAGSETVLDLGCGSGILALCARLLGAGVVFGVDRDESAVRFSRINAGLNGMEDVTFIAADLNSEAAWGKLPAAGLVLANLTADLLLLFRDSLRSILRPQGRVIASGIIRQRTSEVAASFTEAGLHVVKERSCGEWSALLLELK
jgi:ribosomal protein L11 methyltransferase